MLEEVQELVAKKGFDITKEEMYGIEVQHWIGLDVHDVIEKGPSKRTTILQPGMVVASDPCIKIRDENGNVIDGNKIENTVLITEDGCENLTYLIPRTVEEIERVMAEKGITDYLEEKDRKLIVRQFLERRELYLKRHSKYIPISPQFKRNNLSFPFDWAMLELPVLEISRPRIDCPSK
jgi:hypothetical protein